MSAAFDRHDSGPIAGALSLDSSNTALAAVLQRVKRPGSFYAAGESALHRPLIEIDDVGPVALPLLPAQAAQLIAGQEISCAPPLSSTMTLKSRPPAA